jgi:pilus assembly protein CpaD
VTTADFTFDAAAPGGRLAPGESERLNGWFQGLGLGYGDSIYVDGYGTPARSQIAQIAGRYGMLIQPGAPITAGVVQPGSVRVVVSRRRAEVPGCPNWNRPAQPDLDNASMSNYGCSVNSNFASMVADPVDLIHGREGSGVTDAMTASKAVGLYRTQKPTGEGGLKEVSTKGGN